MLTHWFYWHYIRCPLALIVLIAGLVYAAGAIKRRQAGKFPETRMVLEFMIVVGLPLALLIAADRLTDGWAAPIAALGLIAGTWLAPRV